MKGNKIILKISKILAVVLITLVAFVGIYVQKTNKMENIVKEYKYSMDLEGRRIISLKVSDEKETVIKDADGNEIDEELTDDEIAENGYTKEEILDNEEDVLTKENYEKSKKIIEKRLNQLNINNYIIRLDENNGTIYLEIPEDDETDHIVSNISETGKFEIIDADDDTVLMNNEQLKSAKVLYNTETTGTTVYLSMEFNKDGKEKLSEISKTYVKSETTVSSEEDSSEETSEDTSSTETTEENAEDVVTEEIEETTEEDTEDVTSEETEEDSTSEETTTTTTEKKITLQIDDSSMISTSFDEPIENGTIQLSMGSASTDTDEVQDTAEQATTIATLLNNGNLPIKYEVDENKYVTSDITQDMLQKIVIAIGVATLIALLLLIIKYRLSGLFASISFIGFISICSLTVRYANVIITLNALAAMFIVLLLNYAFNIIILKTMKKEKDVNKAMKESYKEFFTKIIPVIVISIVFSFISWIPVSSFGMTLVWGLAIIAIYNILVTRNFVK